MSKSYLVDGMTCDGCARSVTLAIQAVAPNATITVDLAAKQITVTGVDDDNAIATAVADAGFDYGGPL